MPEAFADRLAARVEERRSQICLGLDPDPEQLLPEANALASDPSGEGEPAVRAAAAVAEHCRLLIERAGPACAAVKPQLACFERLGAAGWEALTRTIAAAHDVGLPVIADGKRGDVPVTAVAYGQALVGQTPTPWGPVAGLGADAFTANPLLGLDAIEPLIEAARAAGAGAFLLVRTSNMGAADLQDAPSPDAPLHERLARLVAAGAARLAGECGLSGLGAVVGATEPTHLGRLRELMPTSIFLIPGVGAQGGRPQDLAPAYESEPRHPAAAIVSASRSIATSADPAAAAEELRAAVWTASGAP
jgi:orotidine-5'-phosphate decarboxylase